MEKKDNIKGGSIEKDDYSFLMDIFDEAEKEKKDTANADEIEQLFDDLEKEIKSKEKSQKLDVSKAYTNEKEVVKEKRSDSSKISFFDNQDMSLTKMIVDLNKNKADQLDDKDSSKMAVNFDENNNNSCIPSNINKQYLLEPEKGRKPGTAYDHTIGNTWYYLSSKDFRSYQFDMTKTALFRNTLVCLPTGLGKTYIATNVIYNYYKWFPNGKIFFLAPTKPLVNQQLDSLSIIKGIKQREVCEITGSKSYNKRVTLYNQCRVFFMTPQTLENDLKHNRLDVSSIVLIIYGKLTR